MSSKVLAVAHHEFLSAQFSGLPTLLATEQLSNSVWRILGGNPGKFQLQGTNTYLVGTGRKRLLVDTAQGFPVWIEALRTVLSQENSVVEKVFITHYHHDHIGGISDIRKLFPSVEIYKNQSGGDIYKELKNIQDGDEFSVEGATLKAVFTPGHTQDHMCFLLKEENAIFTGDNVLGHGTAVFEDLKQYMTSLTKMLELAPYRAYPGHGQIIKDSRVKLNEYIRHRQKREMQLIGHMQRAKDEMGSYGALTSMALVKRIYVDVDEALHLAAERGAIQVLEKLKNENTVGFVIVDGEKRWFLKDNCSL